MEYLYWIIILAVFVLMMIIPQRKQKKKMQQMMESLREQRPTQGACALEGSLFFRNSTNLKAL